MTRALFSTGWNGSSFRAQGSAKTGPMTPVFSASTAFRSALRESSALIFPVSCAGCGRVDHALCSQCQLALIPPAELTVTRVRVDGAQCEVWSALSYEKTVRRVILAFKEKSRIDLVAVLAAALRCSLVAVQSTAYPEAFPRQPGVSGVGDVLLPVVIPSTRRAWRRRGFHPTMLVLRRARLLVPPLWHALRLTRQTADQADLSRNDRAHNRAGSMSASSRLAGRSCLIVDDILTTGSTIKEATRAIHAVGGSVLGAATIAHTPLIHNSYSQ